MGFSKPGSKKKATIVGGKFIPTLGTLLRGKRDQFPDQCLDNLSILLRSEKSWFGKEEAKIKGQGRKTKRDAGNVFVKSSENGGRRRMGLLFRTGTFRRCAPHPTALKGVFILYSLNGIDFPQSGKNCGHPPFKADWPIFGDIRSNNGKPIPDWVRQIAVISHMRKSLIETRFESLK